MMIMSRVFFGKEDRKLGLIYRYSGCIIRVSIYINGNYDCLFMMCVRNIWITEKIKQAF